jgi:hypothetical protein
MSRRITLTTLLTASLLSAATVVVPVFILRPFSPQTARGVEIAYRLREASPFVTPVAALLVLYLAGALWMAASRRRRLTRWLGRLALAPVVALSLGAAWLARQNHFEWMFGPLTRPEYARVSEAAALVDEADMVIGVKLHGDAVAYPVRQMGYHHIVNDQVGGVPVASTY